MFDASSGVWEIQFREVACWESKTMDFTINMCVTNDLISKAQFSYLKNNAHLFELYWEVK